MPSIQASKCSFGYYSRTDSAPEISKEGEICSLKTTTMFFAAHRQQSIWIIFFSIVILLSNAEICLELISTLP